MTMLLAAVPSWIQPLWMVPVGVGAALAIVAVCYGLLRVVQPKIAAIAQTTAHESLVQPLFWVELVLGLLLLLICHHAVRHLWRRRQDDERNVAPVGQSARDHSRDLERQRVDCRRDRRPHGPDALLSKPVTRWQFIVGKFLGVLTPVALLYILLAACC